MKTVLYCFILLFWVNCGYAQLDQNAKQDTTLIFKMPGYAKDPLRAKLNKEVKLVNGAWVVLLTDQKGNLVEQISYADKELTIRKGLYQFFQEKKLKQEGNYDKGYKVGLWKIYNEKGLPLLFVTYKWDKLWGNYQEFNEYGKEKVQGFYLNNKRIGKWLYFDNQNQVIKEESYDEDGKLI